jgi:hypothetical protein
MTQDAAALQCKLLHEGFVGVQQQQHNSSSAPVSCFLARSSTWRLPCALLRAVEAALQLKDCRCCRAVETRDPGGTSRRPGSSMVVESLEGSVISKLFN